MRITPLLCLVAAGGIWMSAESLGNAQTYGFSTIAGSAGTGGTRDGTNGLAQFREPGGVAVDAGGTVYVADTANHAIRKMAAAGGNWVVTTIAGLPGTSGNKDGTNSDARFWFPHGISVDSQTNLYVADTYNDTIRKIVPMGTNWVVSTIAGSGSSGSLDATGTSASFYFPYGVAVDSAGNLYVADTYNFTIRLLTPVGADYAVSTLAGKAGSPGFANGTNGMARFQYPASVIAAPGGNLFVADTYNFTIRQIKPSGTNWIVTTPIGLEGFGGSADGTNNSAQFNYSFDLAVDGATNLFVADTSNDTVRKATPVGTNWIVATVGGQAQTSGSNDGVGSAATFNEPMGIAVDAAGNLYVADTGNNTVRLGRLGFALRAILAGGQLVLSWPAAATNYVLETKSALGSGSWTPVTSGIVLSGGNFFKTNAAAGTSGFYRLAK